MLLVIVRKLLQAVSWEIVRASDATACSSFSLAVSVRRLLVLLGCMISHSGLRVRLSNCTVSG